LPTVFSFLGLFYAWFGLTNLIFLGGTAEKMAAVSAVSMGMVFLVGGLITLYLWVACFREPPCRSADRSVLWILIFSKFASLLLPPIPAHPLPKLAIRGQDENVCGLVHTNSRKLLGVAQARHHGQPPSCLDKVSADLPRGVFPSATIHRKAANMFDLLIAGC
jgi:hypothetical protein